MAGLQRGTASIVSLLLCQVRDLALGPTKG